MLEIDKIVLLVLLIYYAWLDFVKRSVNTTKHVAEHKDCMLPTWYLEGK